MGYGKAWASRLLNGGLKSLSDEATDKLEEILDVRLTTVVTDAGKLTQETVKLASLMEKSPELREVVHALVEMTDKAVLTPRYIPTKNMTKLGNQIIAITKENEGKPGKVARLVLELLA